jgi:hypothetical protein
LFDAIARLISRGSLRLRMLISLADIQPTRLWLRRSTLEFLEHNYEQLLEIQPPIQLQRSRCAPFGYAAWDGNHRLYLLASRGVLELPLNPRIVEPLHAAAGLRTYHQGVRCWSDLRDRIV